MKKYLLILTLFLFSSLTFSQTAPANTRLLQANTSKGSVLSLVEMTPNFVYHIGSTNSSEVGFDGLSATSIGLDDMYIVKSNVSDGSNVWFKTYNAGVKGIITPRSVSTDAAENVFVFGQFKGSISVGNRTITSVNVNDAFLMKIDFNGNALWIQYFENGYNSITKTKTVTDGTDTFIIFNNKLAKLNDANGDVLFERSYGCELQSLALSNSDLYLSGATSTLAVQIGSESIPAKSGFILKGDTEASFTKSNKTLGIGLGSVISDIAVSNDEKILVAGFSNNLVSLQTENNVIPYTYNPNTAFATNRLYYFTAKIDSNFNTADYFRTSSAFNADYASVLRADIVAAKFITNSSGYKLLLFINNRNLGIGAFTNANSSETTLTPNTGMPNYSLLLDFDNDGDYSGALQPLNYGFRISANTTKFSQTTENVRLFTTNVNNITTGNVQWTKQKTSAVGGSFSKQFAQHLKSSPNELFVTALVEGKGNFFGFQFNGVVGAKARYITRLGIDGLPKWVASFRGDLGADELTVSGAYINVDKDDNFLFLATISSPSSTFTDASGSVINFVGSSYINEKVLIKIDKNGNYLWSKQLKGNDKLRANIKTDGNGNVYLISTFGGFFVDTHELTGTTNIVKLDSNGNFIFGKGFPLFDVYSFIPVFDAQNNLYVFSEPFNSSGENYVFDGYTVPTNTDHTDHIMLKFDNAGNVIWGKNFYANSPNYSYSWPNDVVFDGTDFVMMGNYYANKTTDFMGLDLINVPRVYPDVTYIPFVAKVSTIGTVIWQKPLHVSFSTSGSYTNINLDENKNMYMYWYSKDKVSFDGTEYSLNAVSGNKILAKIDNSGNLKYFKAIDTTPYSTINVDVMGNDKVNVSGFTVEDQILNYPINYNRGSSFYVATFGNLDSNYLTPTKDYLALNNIVMENNADNANTFSFDLINNVDWNANSDQAWLNLSFLSLTEKNNFQNSINGNGDAKIILAANTNNTGVNRSASVMISGTGVSSKTIIITQNFVLATGENKTFVTTLYPNPTSEVLNIETKQNISKIEIYDMTGKLLKSANGKDKKISVSQLKKGMYLIKLYTENGVVNSKFIKN